MIGDKEEDDKEAEGGVVVEKKGKGKKDTSYWVHKDCTDKGLYVKNQDGGDYEGWCWPGASYYPDFLNGEVRQYFAEQYRLENYQGANLNVFTWNDMNEP